MPRSAAGTIALALALVALAGCGVVEKTRPASGRYRGATRIPGSLTAAKPPAATATTPASQKPAHTEPEKPTPAPGPESPAERESRLSSAREALAHATSPAEASRLHHEISKLVERR